MFDEIQLKTGQDDQGRRLDRILRKALPDYPLSLIHRLLRQGLVSVNGKPEKNPGKQVDLDTIIGIKLKFTVVNHKKNKVYIDENSLPPILFRGSGIIIFNKPSGVKVHGPKSLDSLVKNWLSEKLPASLSFKPGPLHRLDMPSSGAIAFSESLKGAQLFTALLKGQKIKKTYLAIVEGKLTEPAVWKDELVHDKPLKKTFVADGKDAITSVKPFAFSDEYSLVELQIKTGRTHQIRAQAAFHGHPLAGDLKYGGKHFSSFFLHAWKLEFPEQDYGFPKEIIAPLPEQFQKKINSLFPDFNNAI